MGVKPIREHATNTGKTYMITSSTWGRRALFSKERWAHLMIDTLYHYRGSAYLLHEFVVMPDHIHVLLTPKTSLEKALIGQEKNLARIWRFGKRAFRIIAFAMKKTIENMLSTFGRIRFVSIFAKEKKDSGTRRCTGDSNWTRFLRG
jgi:REP element-mobilizing transposase RayT